MLIRYAEGQQRSGRLGATIASHNRYGSYYRAGTVPVNPNTDRQVAVRNAVKNLTIQWEVTLTQALRDAWETYAANVDWKNKLGDTVKLTGLNHYIRSNTLRLQSGIAAITAAPGVFNLGQAEGNLSATASEATQDLTIDGDAGGAWIEPDGWQFFYMGIPQNAGIKFFGGPYRLLTAVPGAGPPPFPVVIAAAWPFQEGQRIWVRSRVTRGDGRLSEFAQVNFLAAA